MCCCHQGVFGGNFHTHNALHIPPGVDVVCFSNGADYARGMRYAVRQAKAGESVGGSRTHVRLRARRRMQRARGRATMRRCDACSTREPIPFACSAARPPRNAVARLTGAWAWRRSLHVALS
jgi:hypothetical protein